MDKFFAAQTSIVSFIWLSTTQGSPCKVKCHKMKFNNSYQVNQEAARCTCHINAIATVAPCGQFYVCHMGMLRYVAYHQIIVCMYRLTPGSEVVQDINTCTFRPFSF